MTKEGMDMIILFFLFCLCVIGVIVFMAIFLVAGPVAFINGARKERKAQKEKERLKENEKKQSIKRIQELTGKRW